MGLVPFRFFFFFFQSIAIAFPISTHQLYKNIVVKSLLRVEVETFLAQGGGG